MTYQRDPFDTRPDLRASDEIRAEEETLRGKPNSVMRVLAIVMGLGIIIANVSLLFANGPGPKFRLSGLIIGCVFVIAGVTGAGLSKKEK